MTNEDWNNKMRAVYETTTHFDTTECGCITRGDGMTLTYCSEHNPKQGTHRRD